jgi:hypothetical protein
VPAARQLPRAFSHFALVNTAHTLTGRAAGMAAHLADDGKGSRNEQLLVLNLSCALLP